MTIKVASQDDLDRITAFLSRFGQIQQSRCGEDFVLIYQPIETVFKDFRGASTSTSRVFKVSRALLDKGTSDGLTPWDFMSTHERDEILVWLTDKRGKELEIAKGNMEKCQKQWELRMQEFAAENTAGTTRIRHCPFIVPRSEWLPDLGLVGEYKTTVEAHIPGSLMNPVLEKVVETVVEVENAENEEPAPAMQQAPLTRMGIKLEPEEFMNISAFGDSTSALGDSGLRPNSSDVADRLLAFRLDSQSSPQTSIYEHPPAYITSQRPENIRMEMAAEKRPVPMSHQQVVWRVEEFVKQARKEEEAREAEEAERKGICLTNYPYHKRKFEADAERIEIASNLHKRTSTEKGYAFGKGKGKGKATKK